MLLHKTDQARSCLGTNSTGTLTLQQRRILILTDGKRSINDIMAMLGNGILADVDALIRTGYLSTSPSSPQGSQMVDNLSQRLRGAASLIASAATAAASPRNRTPEAPAMASVLASTAAVPVQPDIRTQPASTPPPRSVGATRRSLAASKMYVMDLLQMQRDPLIAECRTEIHCAQDETAVAVALLDGVRQLIPLISPGMATRVMARLDEVLPESFLPALRALESEITGKPVLAITNAA